MNTNGSILIATDRHREGELVETLLREQFDNITISSSYESAIMVFEEKQPKVLILAFKSLEKSKAYCLRLLRLSKMIHAIPHQTIVLCKKEDLYSAYGLCMKGYFDNYILFWPMVHDTLRIRIEVHRALKQYKKTSDISLPTNEFVSQSRVIKELELLLEQSLERGRKYIEYTSQSVEQLEKDIGDVLDDFSSRLSNFDFNNIVEIRDNIKFRQEFDSLKSLEVNEKFKIATEAVEHLTKWMSQFEKNLNSQIKSVRTVNKITDRVRPVILVVEDDKFQHTLLKKLLAGENMALHFSVSGKDALIKIGKCKPDLVLMDLHLPDIDGIEVMRRFKSVQQFARIPVIMITGDSEKTVVMDSCKAGATDFLVKPFVKQSLIDKISKTLFSEG